MSTRSPSALRAVKLAARDQRRADRQARRAQRRAQRRCFWTRPFGHEHVAVAYESAPIGRECVGCGKPWR